VARKLQRQLQNETKRLRFASDICREKLNSDETDYIRLIAWCTGRDFSINVGADLVYCKLEMSQLVNNMERAFEFEPISPTSALLSPSAVKAAAGNVNLLNALSSDSAEAVSLEVSSFGFELKNYYIATISDDGRVLCLTLAIDPMNLQHKAGFVAIDAESYEILFLTDMRDKPVLVLNVTNEIIPEYLEPIVCESIVLSGSSNLISRSIHHSRQ